LFDGLWVISAVGVVFYALLRMFQLWRFSRGRSTVRGGATPLVLSAWAILVFFLIAWVIWLLFPFNLGLTAASGIALMVVASDLRYVISNQIAAARHVTLFLRHDLLYGLASPFVAFRHGVNRFLRYWIPKRLT